MATQQLVAGNGVSFVAENDLSAKQYHYVELSATRGLVDAPDNAADVPIGVLQNDPSAGEAAEVITLAGAIAKVVSDGSGAAIAIGDTVGTNNAGKAVKKSVSGDWYNGIALDASSADGKVIEVLLTGPQQRA
ncbi:DUF2190 family protein [Candidatus Poribacteria bacterium]|nr:DUF2190 family protein [Candidatus Poribacteria bacterium]